MRILGPISVSRYNLYKGASVTGNILTGYSTGDVIKEIDRITSGTLPLSMKADWTELMYLQIRAGNTSIYVFFLAIACVFLALSALYESWTLPLAVILVVPLCFSVRWQASSTPIETSTSSCKSAWWYWSAWHARTLFLSSSMPSN